MPNSVTTQDVKNVISTAVTAVNKGNPNVQVKASGTYTGKKGFGTTPFIGGHKTDAKKKEEEKK